MALTYSVAVRNGASDYVVDLLDAGATDANGDLVFMTAGDVEVSSPPFADPAFGASAAGTAAIVANIEDANSTGGTIALCKLQDKDNVEIMRGSVTTIGGGGDIELSSVVIAASEKVEMTSLTYTALG